MGIKGDTGPAGPRGYPGSKGLTGKGIKGDTGNSGITLVDNLDGTFTISTTNPPQSITFNNGAAGNTPVNGVDFLDAASGDYVSFVYFLVAKDAAAPTITDGTGNYNGTVEIPPTGPLGQWLDDPVQQDGFDTYISKNRFVHDNTNNTWSLKSPVWSTPVKYIMAVTDPQNKFLSYVFQRSTTPLIVAPSGGDFGSPTPTSVGWSDGIPDGVTPLYITQCLFTSDGALPQPQSEPIWDIPKLLGQSGTGTKHQFGLTSTGPWHDVALTTDEWMIVCIEDNSGTWVCDTANPINIKGESGPELRGRFQAYAFKRSGTPLNETPTGGTFDSPEPVDGLTIGWIKEIPAGTDPLYISTRMFTSDTFGQDASWTPSRLFSGEGGITYRLDTDSQVFAFDDLDANPTPTEINLLVTLQNVTGPVVWTTVPSVTLTESGVDNEIAVLTAADFGVNQSVRITATSGVYTDSLTIVRVKNGIAGPSGIASETREVRFQFAPDSAGSPGAWHDRPSVASDAWIREGLFIDDGGGGGSVLIGAWSVGTKYVGDDGADTYTEFWFGDALAVGTPDSDPADWSAVQSASDVYLISRTTTLGVVGAWGAITYIRGDDGVAGKYFETRFLKRSLALGAPSAPTDYIVTDLIPTGWVTNPNIALIDDEVIWAITATKLADGSLDVNWITPAAQWGAYTPIKGTDYTDGLAGIHVSKMYASAASAPTEPTGGSFTAAGGEVGVTAGVWLDDPLTPQAAGHYVWETQQTYTASIDANGDNVYAVTQSWTTPTQYAYIPSLGTDYNNGATGNEGNGNFTSYVFRNELLGTTPGTPTDGSYDGTTEVAPTLPAAWTDDPSVPLGNEATWVSKRTYTSVNGVWQSPPVWSAPSLFSAMTAFIGGLTNPTFIASAANDGSAPILIGAGGGFETYYGTLEVTTSTIFTVSGGSDNGIYHDLTSNGLTLRIEKATGLYQVIDNGWLVARNSEVFILIATYPATGDLVTLKYIVTKARDGASGVQGIQGIQGDDGLQGIQGAAGADGINNYFHIAYADDDQGAGFSQSPVGKDYLGTYVDNNPIDGLFDDPLWAWQLVVGATGLQGDQGIQGIDGDTGVSNYLHIAYSTSPTGASGFSTSVSADKTYIGQYVDENIADSQVPGAYTWTLIKGADGIDGQDGNHALTIINYTPAVSLPANDVGVVTSYANSGTTIAVYEGETQLIYDDIGASPSRWRIGTISDTNINVGGQSAIGSAAKIADHNSMINTNAFITYPIFGKRADGTDFSVQATQVFSRADQGSQGDSAPWLSLTANKLTFAVDAGGNLKAGETSSITLTSSNGNFSPSEASAEAWEVTDGSVSGFDTTTDSNTRVITFASLTSDSATIRSIIYHGVTYRSNPITISKVYDAAVATPITDGQSGVLSQTMVGHASLGGNITVNWSGSCNNLFDTISRASADFSLAYQLNGGSWITIDSVLRTVTSINEGGDWLNSASTGSRQIVHNPGVGTINYRGVGPSSWYSSSNCTVSTSE